MTDASTRRARATEAGPPTMGRVVSFDEKNGVGFVRARRFPEDLFVFGLAVPGGRPLRPGQRVRVWAEQSERGWRAVRAEPVHRWPFGGRADFPALAALAVGTLGAAAVLRWQAGWPWAWAWLAAANLLTVLIFVWDKRQAVLGLRRIPEIVLLALSALGGTPAALASMAVLGFKTQWRAFATLLGSVVAVQLVLLGSAWWFWSSLADPGR